MHQLKMNTPIDIRMAQKWLRSGIRLHPQEIDRNLIMCLIASIDIDQRWSQRVMSLDRLLYIYPRSLVKVIRGSNSTKSTRELLPHEMVLLLPIHLCKAPTPRVTRAL